MKIIYLRHNATNILFACWYALCLFFTSDSFCNVENDIKKYLALSGGLIIISIALIVKNPHIFMERLCSSNTLRLLFLTGAILAFQGLLQYIGILTSNHSNFKVTGSFENPAGISAVLALLFPIGLSWWVRKSKSTKIVVGFLLLIYLSVIALSGARAAVVSIIVSSIVVFSMETDMINRLCHNRLIMSLTIILLGSISVAMYLLKANSAIGRLFIWNTSIPLIFDKPWLGYGINGFKSEYMTRQANYFQTHHQDSYANLADNISHPFNEFINVGVNYGIIGLMAFFALIAIPLILALRNRKDFSTIVVACLVSFIIIATFSYPLQYAPVWVLMVLLFALPLIQYLPAKTNTLFRVLLAPIIILSSYLLYHSVIAELNWKRVSERSLEGQTEQMIPYYQKLHDHTILQHNGYFLYNYAAELNYMGLYSESIQMLKECRLKIFDYDIAILYSDNYQNLHQNDSVIKYATLASNMVPCRFLPYSYLLQAYKCKNDTANAVKIANVIRKKKAKIPSLVVDEIKK